MHDFLLNYGFLLLILIAVTEIILTLILVHDFRKKKDPVIICMAIVGVGLCYDAVILAAGAHIMIPILSVLSRVRYVLHGLLIPVNLAVCAFGVPFYKRFRVATLVLTALLMVAGAVSGVFRQLDMITLNEGQVSEMVRFVSVSPDKSWTELISTGLSYGTVVPLIICGIIILIKHKTPTILLSGLFILGFSLIGPLTGNTDLIFLISMFGEMFMLLFYLIFEKRHIEKMYDFYS